MGIEYGIFGKGIERLTTSPLRVWGLYLFLAHDREISRMG
jgi:hypothetical protein